MEKETLRSLRSLCLLSSLCGKALALFVLSIALVNCYTKKEQSKDLRWVGEMEADSKACSGAERFSTV